MKRDASTVSMSSKEQAKITFENLNYTVTVNASREEIRGGAPA